MKKKIIFKKANKGSYDGVRVNIYKHDEAVGFNRELYIEELRKLQGTPVVRPLDIKWIENE